MKRVAVLQSNYIPWKGYFDMINMVDLFIFHDDLQYTKNDWRNRNLIKTSRGLIWLSVPCGKNTKRLIDEVQMVGHSWQKEHWNIITEYYKNAKYFKEYKSFFEKIYLETQWETLSELNQHIIVSISKEILGIDHVQFGNSRNYKLTKKKAERLSELLVQCQADLYISGPAAQSYLPDNFMENKIILQWMDYSGYPEYNQLYPPFAHNVSIIDLIFNEGKNAIKFMKSFEPEKKRVENHETFV
jgi:hypothetical protein